MGTIMPSGLNRTAASGSGPHQEHGLTPDRYQNQQPCISGRKCNSQCRHSVNLEPCAPFGRGLRALTLPSPCPHPALALPSPCPRPALTLPSPCPRPATNPSPCIPFGLGFQPLPDSPPHPTSRRDAQLPLFLLPTTHSSIGKISIGTSGTLSTVHLDHSTWVL